MKLENVKIGDKFSTESKLVSKLGLEIKSGKAKGLQLDEIKRYIDYKKTGLIKRGKVTNEIVITSIRDIPLEKVDGRANNKGGNNSKYAEYIDNLVIQALMANNKHICTNFNGIFVDELKLLSSEWLEYKKKGNLIIASKYKVAEFSVGQYMMQLDSTLRNLLEGCLKRLQKKGHITYSKTYMVKVNDKESMLANEYEKDFYNEIVNIETEILEKMACTKKDIRFDANKRDEFYNDVNAELYGLTGGEVWGYFTVYDIHMIDDVECNIDKEEYCKKLTNELLLSIHKSLSKKESDKVSENGYLAKGKDSKYHPFLSTKLVDFVTKIERKLFTYSDGKIIDADLFKYKAIKIGKILKSVEDKAREQEEIYSLPF